MALPAGAQAADPQGTSAARRAPAARRVAPVNPLAGRSFWRFESHADWAWDNRGVSFLDGRWAYWGIPRGGLPRCRRATARGDGDGCVRYTLNARNGAVTVGRRRGSFRSGKLTVAGDGFYPLVVPRAGARYGVELIHRGFRGLCGLILGCTTWSDNLVLRRDGRFVRSEFSMTTLGGVGTPFVAGWSAPPDSYGTYKVLSRGRIRFSYADGSRRTHTIGIEVDRRGRPAAATEGLLLDDVNFYRDDD